jgi:hypothetical protein
VPLSMPSPLAYEPLQAEARAVGLHLLRASLEGLQRPTHRLRGASASANAAAVGQELPWAASQPSAAASPSRSVSPELPRPPSLLQALQASQPRSSGPQRTQPSGGPPAQAPAVQRDGAQALCGLGAQPAGPTLARQRDAAGLEAALAARGLERQLAAARLTLDQQREVRTALIVLAAFLKPRRRS